MSLENFSAEQGYDILSENGDVLVSTIAGSALPGGDAGIQDDAPIGSTYKRTNGEIYTKIANAGAQADWLRIATSNDLLDLRWRNEDVIALTGDSLSAGAQDPTSWTDNEKGLDSSAFAVGTYVIGATQLWEVTAVSAPNITLAAASPAMADKDAFIVRNYLPDTPAAQENQALVMYNGSAMIKLADVDWNFADGINMAAGYAAAPGNVTASDTVQSSIQKLDGNLDNTSSILGRDVQVDTNMGTYTGTILTDNQDVKTNIQELETAIDNFQPITKVKQAGVTAAVTLDSLPLASNNSAKWLVVVTLDSDTTRRRAFEIYAANDGVSVRKRTVYARLRMGANFDYAVDVDINGGNMRLQVSSDGGPAVTFVATRLETDV